MWEMMNNNKTAKPVNRQGVKQLSGILKFILDIFIHQQLITFSATTLTS
jgi:hypothetical protein